VTGLVLGPVLRHAGGGEAVVWVETDGPCEVEVLGHRSRTFRVGSHHYGLVRVGGLRPGEPRRYGVRLDGRPRWPEPGSPFPPSAMSLPPAEGPLRLAFGSCRVAAPHGPPHALSPEEDPRGLGVDALRALAHRLSGGPAEELPHLLLLLGDQIYAHKPPEETLEFIRSRRDPRRPPGEEVADFEEYCRLYRDSWGDPAVRWLLSTVPSAMIFDDHEISDDWNISEAWVEEARQRPWWNAQITGGLASYWLYQHLGNLPPSELERSGLLRGIRASGDGWPLLEEFAHAAHRKTSGTRWSFRRDLGRVRLLVVDSRAGRVLSEGRRSMLDEAGWAWLEGQLSGGFDHLLFATSLPVLLSPGMHGLQAASEALCAGARGARAARRAERLRRAQDLDHWASFRRSFERLLSLLREVGRGRRGESPASILLLSGDVHHGYVARADLGPGVRSAVYQVVCSPLRNALPPEKRRLQRLGWTVPGALAGSLLSRAAGVPGPSARWRLAHREPRFDNQVATLELEGRAATLTLQRALAGPAGEPSLQTLRRERLA